MEYILKINTFDECKNIRAPKDLRLDWLAKQIDADWAEIVRPVGYDYVLIVDEEGLLDDTKRLNRYASMMYGIYEHGQPIVGDCLLMKEKFVGGEPTLVGMTLEEIGDAIRLLNANMISIRKKYKEQHND